MLRPSLVPGMLTLLPQPQPQCDDVALLEMATVFTAHHNVGPRRMLRFCARASVGDGLHSRALSTSTT